MLNISYFLCNTVGFLRVMYLIKVLLNIIRFLVPIILIIMIVLDLLKNVVDPKNKEGMKKIYNRLIAAIIVFIVPTLVSLVIKFIGKITDNGVDTNYKISSCYTNATSDCIKNIEAYLNCDGVETNKDKCKAFRSCNSYQLSNSCQITTSLDNQNCLDINYKSGSLNGEYVQFSVQGFKK